MKGAQPRTNTQSQHPLIRDGATQEAKVNSGATPVGAARRERRQVNKRNPGRSLVCLFQQGTNISGLIEARRPPACSRCLEMTRPDAIKGWMLRTQLRESEQRNTTLAYCVFPLKILLISYYHITTRREGESFPGNKPAAPRPLSQTTSGSSV